MKLNQGFDGLLYGEMFSVFYETNKKIPTIGLTAK